MKALKIILIILGVVVAIILVVPLFAPATAIVNSEIDIELTPEQVFSGVASFSNRDAWDPWLEMDSTAVATIQSEPGYVGSTYVWEGERLGTGKMEVDSVVENEFIQSWLWFGDMPEPSIIQWKFEATDSGTHVVWSYNEETTYPLGRLRMMIGKVFLKKSLDKGLSNLKAYLEANPPVLTGLGEIGFDTFSPVNTMVMQLPGRMDDMSDLLGTIYGNVTMEIAKQGLEVIGNPFAVYTEWNEEAGTFVLTAGMPVAKPGKKAGEVFPKFFDEMELVIGIHTGPYKDFNNSYMELDKYIRENNIEIRDMAIEIYLNSPMDVKDPNELKTLIAFPVK